MLLIPINNSKTKQTMIIVIFDDNNLDRMREGDPITLDSVENGGVLHIDYPDNCNLMIAYEPDQAEIIEMAMKGNLEGVLKIIQRGYQFRKGQDGNENITELSGRAWH